MPESGNSLNVLFQDWVPIGADYHMGAWQILFTRYHEGCWEFRRDEIGMAHIGGYNNARGVKDGD